MQRRVSIDKSTVSYSNEIIEMVLRSLCFAQNSANTLLGQPHVPVLINRPFYGGGRAANRSASELHKPAAIHRVPGSRMHSSSLLRRVLRSSKTKTLLPPRLHSASRIQHPLTTRFPTASLSTTSRTSMSQNPEKTTPHETPFLNAVTKRRTYYALTPKSSISDERIQEILKVTLEMAPSTFGSYTTRIVLLLKDEHFKFWDMAIEVVKAVTPPEAWEAHTKPRLDGFRNAYGTVLFFEDPENTRVLQDKYPFICDKFPAWAQHTSAMHQFIIWTAFTDEGLGANLQHYNPLVDDKTKTEWKIPAVWDLVAQMPFGVPAKAADPKPVGMKKPLQERLLVHGASS